MNMALFISFIHKASRFNLFFHYIFRLIFMCFEFKKTYKEILTTGGEY